MSEQSLSWFRVYGAIIVRSANRRSLIWSWWRSSAQRRRRRRRRHWLRFRIRIRVGLVTFAFPATHRRRDDVGRAMWAYMVARLGDGFLSAPRHLRSIFKLRFKFFRMFFFISVFYFFQIYFFFFGKVSCSPTETMAIEGDTFFFVRIVFHYFVARLFVIHLHACVCLCMCMSMLFFSFSMIINMETNKASQAKWRDAWCLVKALTGRQLIKTNKKTKERLKKGMIYCWIPTKTYWVKENS